MNLIRLKTMTQRETHRYLKVWQQTVLSPVIIAIMYFLVFGAALSSRIDEVSGISYLAFIVPGLALLQSTSNAFQNPSSSLIIMKYSGNLSDVLLPPLTPLEKTLGYLCGGLLRGLMVAILIFLIAALLVPNFWPANPLLVVSLLILINSIFSLLGTIVGVWAKTFDHIQGFNTFVITPMAFLGGIFYSLNMLPVWAQTLSQFNPFVYFVDSLRLAWFGSSQLALSLSLSVIISLVLILFAINMIIFKTGWKLEL